MNEQIELWKGPFGDDYQERNKLTKEDISNREKFWERIIKECYIQSHGGYAPTSFLELGAGQGANLIALHNVGMKYGLPVTTSAVEINQRARLILSENSKLTQILPKLPAEPTIDLVFTYGVLIHVHPAHVEDVIRKMFTASKKYLLCAEYFAPTTTPKPYRGEQNALWLDDYGSIFLKHLSVNCVGYGFCWKRMTGLDNITYWLFEKKELKDANRTKASDYKGP